MKPKFCHLHSSFGPRTSQCSKTVSKIAAPALALALVEAGQGQSNSAVQFGDDGSRTEGSVAQRWCLKGSGDLAFMQLRIQHRTPTPPTSPGGTLLVVAVVRRIVGASAGFRMQGCKALLGCRGCATSSRRP